MKIILSRKGFDSSAGQCASSILPDGSLVSLPIPDRNGPTSYNEIRYGRVYLGRIVSELTGTRIKSYQSTHFDPDLNRSSLPSTRGWRPMFGQAGAGCTHLQNAGVGRGDLFLFFGWFRDVERRNGRYAFVRSAPDRHILFGWLYVDQVWQTPMPAAPQWARMHPHIGGRHSYEGAVYVAAPAGPRSGGVFRTVRDDLVLTEADRKRSHWLLPLFMHPAGRQSCLSYHGQRRFWRKTAHGVRLRSVGRGQEFVLDGDHYPEAVTWAESLVQTELQNRKARH